MKDSFFYMQLEINCACRSLSTYLYERTHLLNKSYNEVSPNMGTAAKLCYITKFKKNTCLCLFKQMVNKELNRQMLLIILLPPLFHGCFQMLLSILRHFSCEEPLLLEPTEWQDIGQQTIKLFIQDHTFVVFISNLQNQQL